jgi:hypothetical protein
MTSVDAGGTFESLYGLIPQLLDSRFGKMPTEGASGVLHKTGPVPKPRPGAGAVKPITPVHAAVLDDITWQEVFTGITLSHLSLQACSGRLRNPCVRQ